MPASKIQDEQEVVRWMKEGVTYEEMSRRYIEKYNIQTNPSLWGNFRARRGIPRRIERAADLIPWTLNPEHRHLYVPTMLRWEARAQAGLPVPEVHQARHRNFVAKLRERKVVIEYRPDANPPFIEVPARPGEDLVRQPKQVQHAVR